ncbi:MAG: 30S ribosomal protein S6 [Parachlamydiales bacterium]|nr:30S ribosomal protein S6 [Parachlamydiales bacterium]
MSQNRQNLYEGMYILNATLSDDARQKALEKIKDGIVERGGEIHIVHEQGRRKLSYEINGRREGYYYLLYFTIKPHAINELWQEYHIHEDLIRFITLRASQVKEKLEYKALAEG